MLRSIIKKPITWIIVFAFILRILPINYGLPMWLYNDEQPFVLATLKMMQLKTLIPALHQEAFLPFFYYPPYISYLYLPFFILVAAASLIYFPGTLLDFQTQISSDPSIFFITGRIVVVLISLLSIYLIYKNTEFITRDKKAATLSALLCATSILHLVLSITGKHWIPIFLIFNLALYCLANPSWSMKKRYLMSSLVTGLGTGVSTIVILFFVYIVLWFLIHDRKNIKALFLEPTIYQSGGIILSLAIIPMMLYPASMGFAPDTTLAESKTIFGAISSIFRFSQNLIFVEPIVMLLFFIGAYFAIKKKEQIFLSGVLFIYFYSIIFYIFFRFEQRFLLPIMTFVIIGAGVGINNLLEKIPLRKAGALIAILLIFSTLPAIRLSLLGSLNDTRTEAKKWLRNNAPNKKILVYANLMRLPNTKAGVTEQEKIDPQSLRTVDRAEKKMKQEFRREMPFHTLNLYTVTSDDFYASISRYATENGYQYLVLSKKDFLDNKKQFDQMQSLAKKGTIVAQFGKEQVHYSLTKSEIGPTILPLFKIKQFGPELEIYKL